MAGSPRWGAIAATLLLAACIVPVPRGPNPLELRFMTPDRLRTYSEKVFRHQNRVTSRMMMASFQLDGLTEKQRQALERAERRVNESCSSLNELASARVNQEDTGLLLRGEAWMTVRRCEQRAEALEALLDKHGIS